MAVKIKKGTANRPALKNKYMNRAYGYVENIINRNELPWYLKRRNKNYIIKNNGNFKGFAIVGQNKYNFLPSLNLIGTEPGKGYGKALMNFIVSNMAASGTPIMYIHDPVANVRGWYRRWGAKTEPKMSPGNTSKMGLVINWAAGRGSPEVASRQTAPSRQSPKRSSSSRGSSARQSSRRQTPRR